METLGTKLVTVTTLTNRISVRCANKQRTAGNILKGLQLVTLMYNSMTKALLRHSIHSDGMFDNAYTSFQLVLTTGKIYSTKLTYSKKINCNKPCIY